MRADNKIAVLVSRARWGENEPARRTAPEAGTDCSQPPTVSAIQALRKCDIQKNCGIITKNKFIDSPFQSCLANVAEGRWRLNPPATAGAGAAE